MKLSKYFRAWKEFFLQHEAELKPLLLLTSLFCGFMLVFALHRYFTYYASYDHGLFNQLFWNNLHGRFFQSSLSGANSVGVVQDGQIPSVDFLHWGQHFVPDFLLWLPFYALYPHPATLVVLQVLLMAAGGVVLYPLARHYLDVRLSLLITASYFSAIAVIGPTFANFYEHCQIPLFTFGMLLAMEKRRWGIFWVLALLVLGIREDTGIFLFGFGLYLLVSRRHPKVGAILCLLSFAYVAFVTNVVMTQFSDDSARLYLSGRFRQYVKGNPAPSTLEVLWGMLTHPVEVLQTLLTPFDRRFFYLVSHWLPLAFVPALSPSTWLITAPPLLSLLVQAQKDVLVTTLRYSVAIVPGMFYGAILWWAYRRNRPIETEPLSGWRSLGWAFQTHQLTPAFRRFWGVCLVLSILVTILGNPNQAFYFLVPDSFRPWVFISLPEQWHRTAIMNDIVRQIPPDASVSTTTQMIPQLSTRRKIVRLPAIRIQDENGQVEEMEYLAADLWLLQRYAPAFRREGAFLNNILSVLDQLVSENRYGLLEVREGILLLQRGVPSKPDALAAWPILKQDLLQSLEKFPPKEN